MRGFISDGEGVNLGMKVVFCVCNNVCNSKTFLNRQTILYKRTALKSVL